ncbi:hypothetical protein CEXT_45361 [Caerostris extrusa]|uniref:Uncharacterized protein n=1 Tax=Caerostris extrusa TaxID=172846 RepID=A0AAV4VN04_CAEEX|nr:hypothetical protein CEXT_45361 [Caerostris extrusa]
MTLPQFGNNSPGRVIRGLTPSTHLFKPVRQTLRPTNIYESISGDYSDHPDQRRICIARSTVQATTFKGHEHLGPKVLARLQNSVL